MSPAAAATNGVDAMLCDIAIVGGGLGGLALAAGLRRRGFDAHVFEAAPDLRTATSTLIGLGSNGFTALSWLHPEIPGRIKDAGAVAQHFTSYSRTDPDAPLDERKAAPPKDLFVTIRWSEVQRVLATHVPKEAVHCGYRAQGYTPADDGTRVRVHFKGHPDVAARLVVGADGLRSSIRATMLPEDPGPRYLGHMNWNALLYNPDNSVVPDLLQPGSVTTFVSGPRATPGWEVMVYVIDAGGGYTFWQVRVRSEQPSFTPPPVTSRDAGDTHTTTDPAVDSSPALPDTRATEQHAQQGGASASPASTNSALGDTGAPVYLVGGGLGRPGSKARVRAALEPWGFEPILRVVEATPEADIFERAMLDRIPLDEVPGGGSLTAQGGRVILLGDAAHAMHSGPGQGARTAFEDAHTLSLALESQRGALAAAGWKLAAVCPVEESAEPVKPARVGVEAQQEGEEAHAARITPPLARLTVSCCEEPAGEPAAAAAAAAMIPTDDISAVAEVAARYNGARLVRVCRLQRYAAEGCGLANLRAKYAPPGVPPDRLMQRWTELAAWMNKYPAHPNGDPASTYWKPVTDSRGV